MKAGWPIRLQDEINIALTVAVKDVKVYYLTPPMVMFGLMLPLFLFFSFSIKREIGVEVGLARLLALTTFFTASSAGPVIIPLERRMGTYDRLLAAPMSLATLLLGKTLVGTFFATAVSLVPLMVGLVFLGVVVENVLVLLGGIMMPSTLIRWPLMFISGIFVPLEEMAPWARTLAYASPLTYAQDLMNHAVLGVGSIPRWVDLVVLPLLLIVFLVPSAWLHRRSRKLGI